MSREEHTRNGTSYRIFTKKWHEFLSRAVYSWRTLNTDMSAFCIKTTRLPSLCRNSRLTIERNFENSASPLVSLCKGNDPKVCLVFFIYYRKNLKNNYTEKNFQLFSNKKDRIIYLKINEWIFPITLIGQEIRSQVHGKYIDRKLSEENIRLLLLNG